MNLIERVIAHLDTARQKTSTPCTNLIRQAVLTHHSQRVCQISVSLAHAWGLSQAEVSQVRIGALLHDIGKYFIPASILGKPAALSTHERKTIQLHPVIGAYLLALGGTSPLVYAMARWHHERWDGGGYPDGINTQKLPLAVRLVTLADVYDALTSDRPYRAALSAQTALNIIEQESGHLFDPQIAAFVLANPQILSGDRYSMPSPEVPSTSRFFSLAYGPHLGWTSQIDLQGQKSMCAMGV